MFACASSAVNQTAEVSDVYSITGINLELRINHTGNINDNIYIYIYTRYMYPMFTQIPHILSHLLPLIAEAVFGFYHKRSWRDGVGGGGACADSFNHGVV